MLRFEKYNAVMLHFSKCKAFTLHILLLFKCQPVTLCLKTPKHYIALFKNAKHLCCLLKNAKGSGCTF